MAEKTKEKKTVAGKKTETVKKTTTKKTETKKAKEKKTKAKTETKKEKKAKPEKKEKNKGDKKLRKLQKKLKEKARPLFRGRFGNKSIRKISKKKWKKWRVPRGIDVARCKKEDGRIPQAGYRVKKELRFLHPSGFPEARVFNARDLKNIPKGFVVRIAARVGKQKRKIIAEEAKKLNLKLLN